MLRIDAHHHLWRYQAAEFDWLHGALAPLRRDFLWPELLQEAQTAHVQGTVAVQARQSLEETEWLLQVAASSSLILGVVGWLPLRNPRLPELLERYQGQSVLKGLRHVVQAEPPGFLDDSLFNTGIQALRGIGLTYDVLIFDEQLEEATRFVDRHPAQQFILNHIAKPRIASEQLQPWAGRIRELARRPHVFCKVSGMVTEADPQAWSPDQLEPFFDVVLEAFTPARLLVGTDWPVLLAGCSYARWWEIVSGWILSLSPQEQADILGLTAVRTYGLSVPSSMQA